jgi:hypothetical protein
VAEIPPCLLVPSILDIQNLCFEQEKYMREVVMADGQQGMDLEQRRKQRVEAF